MTNEDNMESQAPPTVSADTASDAPSNGAAAPSAAAEASQAPSSKHSATHLESGSDAQEFAKRMKEIFMSANDLACKGPQAAGEFVALIRAAVKPNQKNALAIMLKQTVQKNQHETLLAILNAGVLDALRKWVEDLAPLIATDDSSRSLLVSTCNSMSKLPVTEDHIRQSRIGHALRELSSGPKDVADASSAAREAFKNRLNILSSGSGGRVRVSSNPAPAAPALQRQGSGSDNGASDTTGEDGVGVSTGAEGGDGDSDDSAPGDVGQRAEHEQHASADANCAVQGVEKGGEEVDSMEATAQEGSENAGPAKEGAMATLQRWTTRAIGSTKALASSSIGRLGSIHKNVGKGVSWGSYQQPPPPPEAAQRAAAAAAEADLKFADLIETPESKRQRIEAAGKSLKRVSFATEGLEQVCLFADDRELPGFLTKEEAEEEKQANNSLSPADNRHMRFAESARQEHISESLRSEVFMPPSTTTRDPRAPDAPPGAPAQAPAPTSAAALDANALKRLKPQIDWQVPEKLLPVLDSSTGEPINIARGDDSSEKDIQHRRCSNTDEIQERVARLHVPAEHPACHEHPPSQPPTPFPAETPATKHTVHHMQHTYEEASRSGPNGGPLNSPPTVVYYRHMLEARGLKVPESSAVWQQLKQAQAHAEQAHAQAHAQAQAAAIATSQHITRMHAGHTPMHVPLGTQLGTPGHSPMHTQLPTGGHTPMHTSLAMQSLMHVQHAPMEPAPHEQERPMRMHAPPPPPQETNGNVGMHAVPTVVNGASSVPGSMLPQEEGDSGAIRPHYVWMHGQKMLLTPVGPAGAVGGGVPGVVNGGMGNPNGAVENGSMNEGVKRGRSSGGMGAPVGPPGGQESDGGGSWDPAARKRMREGGWGGDDREGGRWERGGRGQGRNGGDHGGPGRRNRLDYAGDFGDDLGDLTEVARIERGTQDLLDGIEEDRDRDGRGDYGGRGGRGRGWGGRGDREWDDRGVDIWDRGGGRGGRGRGGRGGGSPKVCRYWNTPEGCLKGADCEFLHEGEGRIAVRGRGRGFRGGGARRGRGRGGRGWDD